MPVVAPTEGGVDHAAFRHARRAVATIERQVAALAADMVAEVRVAPAHRAVQFAGIGVDQQLARIEPQPFRGPIRPVDAIAVELPRADFRQIAVPYLVGIFGQRDAFGLPPAAGVEQAEFDLRRTAGEQGEISAGAVPDGAELVGRSG